MNIDGKPVRSLFRLRPGYVHLNCGSHGVSPTEVTEKRKASIDELDSETDLWFRGTFHKLFNSSANLIADKYNAPRKNVTLVDNTTTGISSILNSLNFGPQDVILATSLTYAAITMQCEELVRQKGLKLHVFHITFPFTHDSIISQYEHELNQLNCEGRKLAIIDHITSLCSFLMPVAEIIDLCKKKSVLSLIDGAHAPGQLNINIQKLNPDFYVGNLHKWAFVPRTCGFLYVSDEYLDVVRPLIVSFLHLQSFRNRFAYRGTFDGTIIATIPAAYDFSERLGGIEAIRGYVAPLLRAGIEIVMERLGGSLMCDPEFSAPFMISFYLGDRFDNKMSILRPMGTQTFEPTLHKLFREVAKVVCPTIRIVNGRVSMRVSAHVFTVIDDFYKLSDGLEALEERLRSLTPEIVESWVQRDDLLKELLE